MVRPMPGPCHQVFQSCTNAHSDENNLNFFSCLFLLISNLFSFTNSLLAIDLSLTTTVSLPTGLFLHSPVSRLSIVYYTDCIEESDSRYNDFLLFNKFRC